MFSIRHTIVSMGIAVALAVVATAPAYASETNTISIVKNCATWGTTATCVVTSSRPLGFLSGAVITYGGGPGGHPFDLFSTGTDVQIVTDSPSGAAPGFCHMNPATGLGHCTFSSGTGKLSGFSADLVVTSLGSGNWSLIGSYTYRSDED